MSDELLRSIILVSVLAGYILGTLSCLILTKVVLELA